MNSQSLLFGTVSLVLVLGTWGWYMTTIPRGKVPVRPVGSIIIMGVGIVAGIASLATLLTSSTVEAIISVILSLIALGMAGFFYWLLSQRKTPIGDLKVAVGDQLLPFQAVTSEGKPFHSDQLQGQRILLKFFRGGW